MNILKFYFIFFFSYIWLNKCVLIIRFFLVRVGKCVIMCMINKRYIVLNWVKYIEKRNGLLILVNVLM